MPKTQNTKKKLSLSTLIFTALLLGALFGVGLHYLIPAGHIRDDIIIEGMLYVVGQGFIRLMQMLVVPLVFCSLVCGSMAIGDTKTLGKVGIKTVLFYLFTTAMAVTVALSVASLINPGLGVKVDNISTSEVSLSESKPLTEILLNIIPKNPIESLATADMLPIIVFALFVGIMLAKLGSKTSTVANFFSQFNDIMMEMTMVVMSVAPIGVFCLIARTFANPCSILNRIPPIPLLFLFKPNLLYTYSQYSFFHILLRICKASLISSSVSVAYPINTTASVSFFSCTKNSDKP